MQRFLARYVFPVESPPIQHGVVTVQNDRITDVRQYTPGTQCADLGNVAIVPGLVNAHTHLEFSDLHTPLAGCDSTFASWLRAVIGHRRDRDTDPTYDRLLTMEGGLAECARTGTALVGEIATCDGNEDSLQRGGVDCTVFRELIGSRAERVDANLITARQHLATFPQRPHGWTAGLSPHAPYSTSLDLVQRVVELSARTKTPVAMHLAETCEELELLSSHSGPLVDLLLALDAWNPDTIPRGIQPEDYLRVLALAHRALVVHGNYLVGKEMDLLAARSDRMSVIYCPRTHEYFGHSAYPLSQMLRRGVHVALGTDSRASNPDLDMFGEMRHLVEHHSDVSPRVALRLGTLSGARALGRDDQLGSLVRGKRARLAALALPALESEDPHELLFASSGPLTWIDTNDGPSEERVAE